MIFFHSVLVFIIFDLLYKIPVTIIQMFSRRFEGVFSYLIIHAISSAAMALVFVPFLNGKSTFLQILFTVILGLWGCSGIISNSYKAKKDATDKLDFVTANNCDNRIVASLIYIPLVPTLYFSLFKSMISPDNLVYSVVGFFSKWTMLSIVAAVVGLIYFAFSIYGIIAIPAALCRAIFSRRNSK